MKRCSYKRRIYLERINHKRTRRKEKRIRKGRNSAKVITYAKNWDYIIQAPELLSLEGEKNRSDCVRFIKNLGKYCAEDNKRVLVDFTRTDRLISDGTLMFRAYLCKAVSDKSASTVIKCRQSRNLKINEVLKQIGVFELLGQHPKITPHHKDVINWRYAQGAGALGEKYEDILGQYDGAITDALKDGLYVGLTEAMTNTRQHAYPDSENDEDYYSGVNEWWMFSQEMGNRLYVVFCDLGVGIPGSLPSKRPNLWKNIKQKFGSAPQDSKIIEEAIKYSQTRTEEKHRGKGLKQLTNVLENTLGGILYVHSNHGCYTSREGEIATYDYRNSISGTLISWSLPLSELT